MRCLLLIWSLILPWGLATAQNSLTSNFRLPLNISPVLTGNFGEMRATHFHAGLDFRTAKTIGLPVVAAAEGYVSRLMVSVHGYGKAVYVNHPNGYTTVYAHLEKYAPRLDSLVRNFQYQNRFYEVDVNLPPGLVPVARGEMIGFSGNSGSSTGPHLHFEIRDTQTDEPINPLLFGLPIADRTKPQFGSLRIVPAGPGGLVAGSSSARKFSVEREADGRYRLKKGLIPEAGGYIALAVEVWDREDGGVSNNAIYQMQVFVDDSLVFQLKFDRFTFEESARVSAHADPEERARGHNFHLCRVLPNDDNQIFYFPLSRGIFRPTPGKVHTIRIVALDVQQNTSQLSFRLRGVPASSAAGPSVPPGTVQIIDWRKPASWQAETIRLNFPANSVLDTLYLTVTKNPRPNPFGYATYTIGPATTALRKKYQLGIRYQESPIPPERYCIVHGKRFLRTRLEDGFLTTHTDRFGEFTVKADTTRPEIRFLFGSCQDLTGFSKLQVHVRENESGVRFWYAELNGQFLLFEYEYKDRLMTAEMPMLAPGDHVLDFWVMDYAGNISYSREYFKTGIEGWRK